MSEFQGVGITYHSDKEDNQPATIADLKQAVGNMTNGVNRWGNYFLHTLDDLNIFSVSTDKLVAGEAKIGSALIETLTVGTNVQIGTAQDAAGVTTIVGNTVTTSYVNALNVAAASVTTQHAVISNGSGTGSVNINLGTSDYVSLRGAYTTSGNTFIIGKANSPGGSISTMERIDMFAGWLYVYNNLYVNTKIEIAGNEVATQTWVEGKGYITQSDADTRYVNAGTGGSKTISHINATDTGIVIWFTDGTNKTVLYD